MLGAVPCGPVYPATSLQRVAFKRLCMMSGDDNCVDLLCLNRAISPLPVFDGKLDFAIRSQPQKVAALRTSVNTLLKRVAREWVSGRQTAVSSLAYPT
jgi:hypothetical protein